MNIFVVSRDWDTCARALDDKRLNKMILECAQMLCAILNLEADPTGKTKVTPYGTSHPHHPMTKWLARDVYHQRWLWQLGMAYGREITHRFGRKHACQLVLEGLTFNWPRLSMVPRILEEDEFYNGARHTKLGLDFTHLPVRKAYRKYLSARWPNDKRKPVWTNREQPTWYS